jgi:hypothetical protein
MEQQADLNRTNSGSYVMAYVLADQHNWLSSTSSDSKKEEPFSIVPSGDFAALRRAVRQKPTTADFFMWEHFTTKAYWDNGELKRIGEIYTPSLAELDDRCERPFGQQSEDSAGEIE